MMMIMSHSGIATTGPKETKYLFLSTTKDKWKKFQDFGAEFFGGVGAFNGVHLLVSIEIFIFVTATVDQK